MRLCTWLTAACLIAATVAAVWLMVGQYGRLPGFDFGCGQYYYTDIPDWPRYFSVRGIVDTSPRWVCFALFAGWGFAMYRLWTWLDRRSGASASAPDASASAVPASAAFPLFLAPSDARCLVLGSGRIAAHKAETLRGYGLSVDLVGDGCFDDGALARYALVVAATSDRAFNRRVSDACRAARVLVNVVDDPARCSFYFAAVERKGPITVAVSTNGTCPVAGRLLRDRIRPLLTDRLVATAERLGREREDWKRTWPDPAARAAEMRKEFGSC